MLLKDMGRAGVAVMVLGTAACATESTQNATPTEEPGTASTEGTTSSTAASQPATTETTSAASPGEDTSSGYDWHRVNLGFVSAYILHRGSEALVVDTGVANNEASIEAALGEIGLGWPDVSGVIITHKHPDHQGSLEGILAATDEVVPWFAGAGDIDAITAPNPGTAVHDGERLGGLEIIETPGHTPGHISVLDLIAGVLVAGDALNGSAGGLIGASPDFSEDMDLANASVVKLASFDYEVALFGHGEPVLEGASGLVADLAAGVGNA